MTIIVCEEAYDTYLHVCVDMTRIASMISYDIDIPYRDVVTYGIIGLQDPSTISKLEPITVRCIIMVNIISNVVIPLGCNPAYNGKVRAFPFPG